MRQNPLKDKVTLITGASSGIGKAAAIALARRGSHLVLASCNRDALQEVKEEIHSFHGDVFIIPTDVTRRKDVRQLVQKTLAHFSRVDIFIGNAGLYVHRPVFDLTFEDAERVMTVNYYGVLYGIFELLPHMLERKSGHILVVSSVGGKIGLPLDSVYNASKFAITGFTKVKL